MTCQPSEAEARELEALLSAAERLFGSNPTQLVGAISAVWMVGVTERLAQLGIVSGGVLRHPGMDKWEQIDKFRFSLLPPNYVGVAIKAFVESASVPSIRDELAEMIAAYYTVSGRNAIVRSALEHLLA